VVKPRPRALSDWRSVSRAPGSSRWRLACFDLDGTLVRGTTVSQHLADRFGQGEQMAELERRYATGEISNSVVAEEQARNYRGIPLPQVVEKLSDIVCIDGIDSTLATLHERGIESLLGTVTWTFAAEEFGRRHGFVAVSGTEIDLDAGGVPTGGVRRNFDEWDKLKFVASYCEANGIDLAECVAVGDSRSDVPLFEAVGFSIALNATSQAREAASVALDTEDLTDILDLIPWG
jgi:phosphoserine phosphatase